MKISLKMIFLRIDSNLIMYFLGVIVMECHWNSDADTDTFLIKKNRKNQKIRIKKYSLSLKCSDCTE